MYRRLHAHRLLRPRPNAGFTLIEALVTVVVIGIIMVALWQALAIMVRGAGLVKQRTIAMQIAANHLNDAIAEWTWTNADSGDDSANYDTNEPALYHWQIQTSDFAEPNGTSDLQQVECVVSWKAYNRDYSVTVATLMFDQQKTPEETTTQ
ncbi:MAG TPA: prepilin-type N-terminal cleavage/methylation domain-containing protein [Phycisphaerae bacterium]|nr:prepilin-type N-terminal cleavage/methylation domain-containing protein [Phycisphaerae bacterium]